MGLWAETQAPTLHPKHSTHAHTHTHTQMSGVAKSLGESTSFQYGLLPGAPDAATGRPPLRDPLICDKSCPCILIILFQLQNPIPTPPNCLLVCFLSVHFTFMYICLRSYVVQNVLPVKDNSRLLQLRAYFLVLTILLAGNNKTVLTKLIA